MFSVGMFFKGFFIGIANIIPGLSGGTMAVILGVYQLIIDSVSGVLSFRFSQFVASIKVLSILALGASVGIYGFSYLMGELLVMFDEYLSFFFIGIVLASIPYLIVTEKLRLLERSFGFFMLFFVAVGGFIVWLSLNYAEPDSIGGRVSTIYLFLSSFFAAAAMIIPGVSGSLLLVIMGTYTSVIMAIKSFLLLDLFVIACGSLIGILVCARFLKFCLNTYFQATMCSVIGLMLGTLPGLYDTTYTLLNIWNFIALLMGMFLVALSFFLRDK